MDVEGLLSSLPDGWRRHWQASQASYPGKDIEFLKSTFIEEANRILRLPESKVSAFYDALDIINNREELSRLAWHCHYLLFNLEGERQSFISEWDALDVPLGNFAGMFTALVLLSGLPGTLKFYKDHGIPDNVLIATFSDMEIWMNSHYRKTGVWGLSEIGWLINHVACRIFRLGRLQVMPDALSGRIQVYRNRLSGKVIALSEPGIKFREDGQVDGTNHIFDPEYGWTSRIDHGNGRISGNPIHPLGRAGKDMTVLAAEEWEAVLSAGDPVLAIHIPEDGKLSFDDCGESLKMAAEFFRKHFSQFPYRAYSLCTWFLDAQLRKLLPSDSNIVKFQKEFYLYPVLSDEIPTYERVFGSGSIDLRHAPRDTLLRRAILDHVAAGNHMRYSAGFILKDDIDNWGQASYQFG